ncbi:MAG: cation transporter [Gammaproteobacteria bacterium]|nr:cation transporter [Gammaproteobacteria bacterium]NIR98394.1 cation transporter [Gammaproteobacteria bacterium]NIT64148.1 cation transporter [Gammaproteobacteria bacterium]NIV21085.1 cation diffusion facilitator family transporter [Gammaproteobacteria bacterium]NIY32728.1 cation diffusion facilitator family transporter [Gammaproteobacteria bacterium]
MQPDEHRHIPAELGSERRMLWALVLTGGFMVVEVAGGLLSGSLALLADAGHMLTDTTTLALAWGAARAARKPADTLRSYGYHRAQVLAAFLNGVLFLAIVVWILVEAVRRLLQPVEILGGVMLAVAAVGLMVNVAAFAILHGGDRENLNVRAAILHVLGDLLGSVAALAAAGVILWTGWTPIDPLLSVAVAALILRSAWFVVRESTHILLEGTPEHVDVEHLREILTHSIEGVRDVHHVHVWSLTQRRPLVTLHVLVDPQVQHQDVLCRLKRELVERFGIGHSTIQLEHGQCADER